MATATARLLEEIVSVGTRLAVRFDDARRELEAEKRPRREFTESPTRTAKLESLEVLLREMREEHNKSISELRNELAVERAAREEKDKEVAGLTVRLSQAEESLLHQKDETCKIWEAISRALCQSTAGAVVQDEARDSENDKESLLSTFVAQSALAVKALEQQNEETRKVWKAIYVTSEPGLSHWLPTCADVKIIDAHSNTTVLELNFDDGPVSDLGLLHLPYLTSLKSLRIPYCVDVTALSHLYAMTWLEELKLESHGFLDKNIQGIGNLMALHRLELIGTQVTDSGLFNLKYLGSLKVLVLSRGQNNSYHATNSFSSAGMVHVGKLTSLEALDIGISNVGDDGLAHLVPLSKLTWLSLPRYITDQGMVHLKHFKFLKTVWLRNYFQDYQHDIECLKALPCLEKVGVRDWQAATEASRDLPNVKVAVCTEFEPYCV